MLLVMPWHPTPTDDDEEDDTPLTKQQQQQQLSFYLSFYLHFFLSVSTLTTEIMKTATPKSEATKRMDQGATCTHSWWIRLVQEHHTAM
jgi:hypothetical protein